jgi:methyltransferase-like protein/SAM-dependent methyltransferase
MPPTAPNPYDVVPYFSRPISQTHPTRMATVAALLSLSTPDVSTARILELGCAAGGNCIPLACDFPDARIVGVDYSAVQIADGRRIIDSLGLTNIDLRHGNIADVDPSWGTFDFIICHGVFSWVPPKLQDNILGLTAELLAPDGIAYVSYNTYPGWHLRGVVRHLMRYHAARFDEPRKCLLEVRRILDVVATHAEVQADSVYGELLKREAEMMRGNSDQYIYHEHLEEYCEPIYFHEFVGKARACGLDYLGEAHLASMVTDDFHSATGRALAPFARDNIDREQFMDFVINRTFRKTLLCRAGRSPSHDLPSSCVWPMFIASGLRPESEPADLAPGQDVAFANRAGQSLATSLPILKASLVELCDHWPAGIPFERLLAAATGRLNIKNSNVQRTLLGRVLLSLLTQTSAIEVSCEPSKFTISPCQRPTGSQLARHQAQTSQSVTNRRHESIELSLTQWRVMQLLDGNHNFLDIARITNLRPDEVEESVSQLARLALILD